MSTGNGNWAMTWSTNDTTKPGPTEPEAHYISDEEREDDGIKTIYDLLLTIPNNNGLARVAVPLSIGQAWKVRDVLGDVLIKHGGRSLVGRLEDQLNSVIEILMGDDDLSHYPEVNLSTNEEIKGWAFGVAQAIAVIRGMSVDQIRSAAMARYDAAHPADADTEEDEEDEDEPMASGREATGDWVGY